MNFYPLPDVIPAPSSPVAIAIDVLRATSVMAVLLSQGASSIRLTDSLEKTNNDAVCVGEREGKIIPGYDFGNSPIELLSHRFDGKNIVMNTTNGTRLITSLQEHYNQIIMLSFVNFNAVKDYCQKNSLQSDVYCAGSDGGFSPEDAACGAMLCRELDPENAHDYERYILSSELLRETPHALYLREIGFGDDVDFCLQSNLIDIVPSYGKLTSDRIIAI